MAGAYVADDAGAPFDLDAYLAAAEAIARRGGTPVIFPSYGLNALADDGVGRRPRALGARLDRFIGFELGPMFVPYGRIVGLDAYRGLMDDRRVHRRQALVAEPPDRNGIGSRCGTRIRPDFHVFTGNDLAIDMVMYGSDYLLGLSTFAPEPSSPRRDRMWARRRPGVPRAQRRAAVPRRVRVPRAGARLPPRRRDVVRAPRLGRDRRDPARCAPPARTRTATCSGRSPSDSTRSRPRTRDAGDRYPQVKTLRSVAALRARLDELGVDIPVADDVDPGGPLATPVSFTDASAGTFTAPNRFAVLPMEGWDGIRRPARPPISCAAGGTASRHSGARPGVGRGDRGASPTAGPTRTSS